MRRRAGGSVAPAPAADSSPEAVVAKHTIRLYPRVTLTERDHEAFAVFDQFNVQELGAWRVFGLRFLRERTNRARCCRVASTIAFGLAATAEFGVVQDAESASVRPDHAALERIKSAGIENADLYIDFPAQYAAFDTLSVDEQADALVALGRNQSTQGYRFVWAVAQGHCTPHCDHKPCPEPCDSCPFPYNGTHGSSRCCATRRAR